MAFKMKGSWLKSALKSHPSKELDKLQSDVETFQEQVAKNLSPQSDLDHAEKLLEEYMMDPHDEAS